MGEGGDIMRKYRVWTKDIGGITIHTEWMSRWECVKYIKGRWKIMHPWIYISSARSMLQFTRHNGR